MESNSIQPQAHDVSDFSGDWFAVRVRPKSERSVALGLERKGYPTFLPLGREYRNWSQRVRKVERVLITGYVFAQFDPLKRLPVLTVPGVSRIVGTRSGPLAIPGEELSALRLIAESGSHAEPWPFLGVGERVLVVGGPLRGLRGALVEVKNQTRVVVSLTILQRSVAAEVDRDYVYPATDLTSISSSSMMNFPHGSPA